MFSFRPKAFLGLAAFALGAWFVLKSLAANKDVVETGVFNGASPKWNIGHLDTVRMHVQNTVHYQLNGSLAEAQWSSLIPEGGGIVRLGPNREPFMLSMYHQLRCLDLIRKAYIHGANGDRSFDAAAGHCLNYIRQMVFCRGDLRLERVVDPNGPHAVQVRETTTCQDWTAVYNKVHEVYGRDVV